MEYYRGQDETEDPRVKKILPPFASVRETKIIYSTNSINSCLSLVQYRGVPRMCVLILLRYLADLGTANKLALI